VLTIVEDTNHNICDQNNGLNTMVTFDLFLQ